jgi:2,3,4,5-tetrahydropyridine-2,6-dicarboxylate N-succinyltransferase
MLREQIEELFDRPPQEYTQQHARLFQEFKDALNVGEVRAAEPDAASPSGWLVNAWVKKGILLGFRMGTTVELRGGFPADPPIRADATQLTGAARQQFFDKNTYPVKTVSLANGIRIVPGGSSIRDGCFLGKGVTCMPPMFINVGAYVGDQTMVDSHALVGSCAQIGKNCHLSAAAQIGGVLEPVGAMPVIIEDDVIVGGNCGVFEGTVVKREAVIGTGTILNRSTPVYDLVRGAVYTASEDQPLVIPEKAVVVAGSRPISHGRGKEWGLSLYTPVIVKYRDAKTDLRTQLEDLLR